MGGERGKGVCGSERMGWDGAEMGRGRGQGKGEGGAGSGQQASASRASRGCTRRPLCSQPLPTPRPAAAAISGVLLPPPWPVPCRAVPCLVPANFISLSAGGLHRACLLRCHATSYIIRRHPAPEQYPTVGALPSSSSSDVRACVASTTPAHQSPHRARHPARRSTDTHAPPITHPCTHPAPPKYSPHGPKTAHAGHTRPPHHLPIRSARPSARPHYPRAEPRRASNVQSPAPPQASTRPCLPSPLVRSRAPRRAAPPPTANRA